ncbi:MAG: HD domain-containing protein [Candidatus Thermoplasmatota archaeon]
MKDCLEVFLKMGELKRTEREGWKRLGIDDPESVADHSFRAAFMALLLGEKFDLNSFRLIKLLLIHDLAEAETGDLTPHDYDTEKEKFEMEKKAVESIFNKFDDETSIVGLWKEFEIEKSQEAKIARDIDKLEMILQALEYREEYPDKDLSEFIHEGKKKIKSQEINEILDELLES